MSGSDTEGPGDTDTGALDGDAVSVRGGEELSLGLALTTVVGTSEAVLGVTGATTGATIGVSTATLGAIACTLDDGFGTGTGGTPGAGIGSARLRKAPE